ncbi:MAG: phosphoethanolamine transferase [Prosthecobacter sp.]|uniref:phosphoethanolamine transferase n=1 Tax=Prosthecobacter sp. TaxID=1965333 RepID=UPI003900A18E
MNIIKRFKDHLSHEFSQHGRIWFSVFLAVSLINLPNLIACFIPGFAWVSVKLWLFSMALTLLACALGLRVRAMLWLALPLIVLVPACIACLLSIHNLPTTFLFLALLETNQVELSSFQGHMLYSGLGTVILMAVYVWVVKARVPAGFRFGPAGRVLVLGTLLTPAIYDLMIYNPVVSIAGIKQRCLSTFPCSTVYGAYEALDLRARVQNRQDLLGKLAIDQEPEFREEHNRQVHMLVIGESATKSCFGLYGYERETTPLLERTPGLLPFRDVASTATVTLLAVPSMITASPPGKVIEATQQTSLLTAYKKAGFRVYWLSAQRKHGTFDTLTSIFAEDADEAVFKGGKFDTYGAGAYGGTSDASLLPLVRNVLQRNEPKVLFVLHTIGSHGPYPSRYSEKRARFPADRQAVMNALRRISSGTASDPQELQLVQNSYDNTICATDFLLANLIHDLNSIQASSWLCYISDHGENTSKALLGKFMHGMITRQVVEIPMLMWLSPLYEQTHPAKAAALKANLNTSFSAACTFHTVLDMGGLSCADFKKEWSCASPQFNPGPRLVCDSNGKITDYDQKFPPLQASSKSHPKQASEETRSVMIGTP